MTYKQKRTVLLVPVGTAAMILMAASAAWACSVFMGVFEVKGDASDTSVLATGKSWNGCQPGTCMKHNISGQTAVSADGGSVTVQTYAEPGTRQNALPDGPFHLNWRNGANFKSHNNWSVSCMNHTANPEVVELDIVDVVGGQFGPATYDLPDGLSTTEATGGKNFRKGESNVCLSSTVDHPRNTFSGPGTYGNMAPITVL